MVSITSSRTSLVAAFALICAFSLVLVAKAVTLNDYQHRVTAAAALIEELRGAGEDESNPQPGQFITTNLTRVRQMLPAKETVLVDGQSVAVDNAWLHEELAHYEKTNDATQRAASLTRAAEALRAIDERVQEILRRKGADPADKDAEKGRLAEILRRPEYIQTAPQTSAFERLLKRIIKWL